MCLALLLLSCLQRLCTSSSRPSSRAAASFAGRRPPTAFLTLSLVSCQPFQLMSKTMPFGSLNLRSKPSSSGSSRSKKNFAAGLLDLLLLRGQVVALEAEVVDAGPARRHARADLALVLQEREVHLAVAHVDLPGGLALLLLGALHAERLLVEVRGRVDVPDAERDVPEAGGRFRRRFRRHFRSHGRLHFGVSFAAVCQLQRIRASAPGCGARPRSFRLEAGAFDHLAPFLDVARDPGARLGRREDHRHRADIGVARFQGRVGEACIDIAVEALDDLGRASPQARRCPSRR